MALQQPTNLLKTLQRLTLPSHIIPYNLMTTRLYRRSKKTKSYLDNLTPTPTRFNTVTKTPALYTETNLTTPTLYTATKRLTPRLPTTRPHDDTKKTTRSNADTKKTSGLHGGETKKPKTRELYCESRKTRGIYGETEKLLNGEIKRPKILFGVREMVKQDSFVHSMTKIEWIRSRPMIRRRIEKRFERYPFAYMIPVAQQVRNDYYKVVQGVSHLLKVIPVVTCKFCPEVYVGETGHLVRNCRGYDRLTKNQVHHWIKKASIDDILVPLEAFHLENIYQEIHHRQRFDFDRVPAVLELCHQAGAHLEDSNLQSPNPTSDGPDSLSTEDLSFVGSRTLEAWERLRKNIKKLMVVYPIKVCKHCSEVHVGNSGHMALLCGIFTFQSWRGKHFWLEAKVDDIVPPKIVLRRRPRDPPVLVDEGRGRYGHAPAVVDLCCQAGAPLPVKYLHMMKV